MARERPRFYWHVPCKLTGIDMETAWDNTVSEFARMPMAAHQAVTSANEFLNPADEAECQAVKQALEQRVAERTRQLSMATAQLQALSEQALAVRNEERSRIAREIQGELGSLLITLKLDLDWLGQRLSDREPLAGKCRNMIQQIEAAVANVGRIITDLRPSVVEQQGLMAALEWQMREFAKTTELECDSLIDLSPDCVIPQGAAAATVFRIFQEILNNVARHAHATMIRIRVRFIPGLMQLDVTDNGVGAAPSSFDHPDALGVMGMRERTRQIGGSLHIVSVPGGGTHVCLRLPLIRLEAKLTSHRASH